VSVLRIIPNTEINHVDKEKKNEFLHYLNILHPVVCIVNDILKKTDNTTISIDTNKHVTR
jgi:hypothetical protein